MTEFLVGDDLSRKIREVVEGGNVRCAVAFWGRDAVRELFGTELLERDDVHVICDLSMGGTNPDTLRALGAPNNPNVRFRDGLHAKVFLSENGAVVGSANASNNGIGFMGGNAQLLEAGTYLATDSDAWRTIGAWFDDLLNDGSASIDAEALQAAQLNWRRRGGADIPFRADNPRDFLNYDSRVDGLVYPMWYTDTGAEGDYTAEVHREFGPVNIEYTTHLSPQDAELRGKWVCSYRINRDGYVDRRLRPRFFFANSLIEGGSEEIDPEYGNVLGQSPYGLVADGPFSFDDPFLIAAFRAVINDSESDYGPLRGDVDNVDEPWLACDYVELMHRFWRDVQDQYRRRQGRG